MADEDPPANRHTWVTYVLVAANVAMFGVALARGVTPIEPAPGDLIAVGASYGPLTLGGEYWRLATAMFLHFGLLHLALNMVCLWQGRTVETMLGGAGFAVVYVLAGLAGGIASLARGDLGVAAGASGAVFGVYGAFAAFLVVRKDAIPPAARRTMGIGIASFVGINIVFGLAVPGIDLLAHVGGLVFGFVVAAGLLVRSPRAIAPARVAIVAVAGLAIIVGALAVLPRPELGADAIAAIAERRTDAERALAAIEAKRARKELADPKAADALDRDVVAPWKLACGVLADAAEPSPRYLTITELELADCAVRLASWELLAAAWRAEGERREGLMVQHRFAERDHRELAARLVTARAALRK